MFFVLSLLIAGLFSGLLAGLLGVGGGMVLVPVLIALLPEAGVPASHLTQAAVGTSLACIVLTATSSTRSHFKRGGVIVPVFLKMLPGLLLGAICGAAIADYLSSDALRQVFAIGTLIVAGKMLFDTIKSKKPQGTSNASGNFWGLAFGGWSIGTASALVGIGGGTFTVPFLHWLKHPIAQSVGTSAACGLPIAFAGAAGFAFLGWSVPNMPSGMLGYIHLYSAFCIVITSTLAAPIGARLAHKLPAKALKQVFAAMLVIVAFVLFTK